jgi:hypothetical protein
MMVALNNKTNELEEFYIDLLVKMNIFLEKLVEFCEKTSNYII